MTNSRDTFNTFFRFIAFIQYRIQKEKIFYNDTSKILMSHYSKGCSSLKISFIVFFLIINNMAEAGGQVLPDNTLPSRTILNRSGNTLQVNGGTQKGKNLFHSFSKFNVDTNQKIYFNSNSKNIIARITSSKKSRIDGKIYNLSSGNLFLLGSGGFIFGSKSKVQSLGSVFISTANKVKFSDGFEFTINSKEKLSDLPSGQFSKFIFERNNGDIEVTSSGHNLIGGLSPASGFPIDQGILISPSKTIYILGKNVNFDGALISANGIINVGALEKGELIVKFKDNEVVDSQYSKNSVFGNINLTNRSLLNALGLSLSKIDVTGKKINSDTGSLSILQSFETPGGSISYKASDSITISGTNPIAMIPGGIFSENFSANKGSSIILESPLVKLINGGNVTTRTFSNAASGDITVKSSNLKLIGSSPRNSTVLSSIRTDTALSSGSAGNIRVLVNNLAIKDGALLGSISGSDGNSGNVFVNASEDIYIDGIQSEILSPSAITSSAFRFGNSGDVNIKSSNLYVRNGGRVDSATTAFGDAGSVNIDVNGIFEIASTDISGSVRSTVSSSASLLNDTVRSAFGILSPSGSAGSVNVETESLIISDRATLNVQNDGTGRAGTLKIIAKKIWLTDNASIAASTNGGDGGNISTDTAQLSLSDSVITSSAKGEGEGGNIDISSNFVSLNNGSRIQANAENAQAGAVRVESDILLVDPDSIVESTSARGPQFDGSVTVNTQNAQLAVPAEIVNPQKPIVSVSDACSSGKNSITVADRKLDKEYIRDPELISAADLKRRLAIARRYKFRDESGQVHQFKRWLGVEKLPDGKARFIYDPSQNIAIQKKLVALERFCAGLST